ncbi:hypothetical protein NliqN6_1183 [Naganishia liquefaciens]|uniref:Uncharacterized protein n=1 Tax=Naganishia liquefaciens TaxID=104408 RepID=A0A8H3TP59_9TREE|nr:hypothetical protein NliqN6_1183 [Naganishia liquefaciens]
MKLIDYFAETYTIVAGCIYFFAINALWHLPILRDLISGFKLFVVGMHELFHILVGMIVGGEVVSVCIDVYPGLLVLARCSHFSSRLPWKFHCRIPANCKTAALFAPRETLNVRISPSFALVRALHPIQHASLMIYNFAVDIVASKIASFVVAIGLLVPATRVDSFVAFLSIASAEGILIGLWFGDHGNALRFYILFVGKPMIVAALQNHPLNVLQGVMHLFYVVWDYTDERFFDKLNASDCSQFSSLLGFPPSVWACIWILYSMLVYVAAIFAGIIVWKKTTEEMYEDA